MSKTIDTHGRKFERTETFKKVDTASDTYGGLCQITAPEGYEFTGEFRTPISGDTILSSCRDSAGEYTPLEIKNACTIFSAGFTP